MSETFQGEGPRDEKKEFVTSEVEETEAVDIEELEESELDSEKVKAETHEVSEAVFGELLRDKVYEFVERVQQNPLDDDEISLTLSAEDVKKLIKMHREGTLPN